MKATVPMTALLVSLALAGCIQQPTPKVMPGPVMSVAEAKRYALDQRKNEVLRELATCESGGHGEAEQPIIGGRGAYIGRFQFMPRTVISYVQQMDGRTLSLTEAKDLAHDYDQAKELAKYMIFEQGRVNDWPLCARKIGLRAQVEDIKSQE